MKKPKSSDIFNDADFPISIVRKTIFQGTGTDMEEAKDKPLIAIASSQTDINPGHMHLSNLALRVKEGYTQEEEFPSSSMCRPPVTE